jgi:hypothetical protein
VGEPGRSLLAEAIGQWRGIIARPADDSAGLAVSMRDLYSAVYETDFARLEVDEVRRNGGAAGDNLFDLYLTLRDRIPEWHAIGAMRDAAPLAVRNAMRILRYTGDIVGEVANGYPRLGPGEQTHRAFSGPPGWTMMHPRLADGARVSLEAGDVVLVRGQLHNSAAIARIGDVDSQFSHVGIVHIDEDGQRWLVEALIEEGSVWSPLDEALSHGLGRAVLFRHRDAALARRAATLVAEHVRAARRGLFGWLPYDFSMQLDGDDRFFCSKLVRHGYVGASGGAMHLPTFPTRLTMHNRDFFERLGVTAVDTFAPADFEVEPAFDVVAEWRDYRVTSNLRMQDQLMSKLFDWMEQHDYQFRETVKMGVMALTGRASSLAPDLVKSLLVRAGFPKIPLNMQTRTISTIGMLHDTAEPILQRLIALETDRIRTTGRPMHPREVQAELERYRAASGGRIGYLVAP